MAQNELKQVEADLDRESREDGELRDRFQQRWARPASAALNSTLREKIAGAHAVSVGRGLCGQARTMDGKADATASWMMSVWWCLSPASSTAQWLTIRALEVMLSVWLTAGCMLSQYNGSKM